MDGAELMRKVVAGFAKSDLQPLLDAIHEEIVWKTAQGRKASSASTGNISIAPACWMSFRISMDYTFHHLKPKRFQRRRCRTGTFDVSLLFDPKGKTGLQKPIKLEIAILWRLKDGKIIEHQGFWDTASMLDAAGLIKAPGTSAVMAAAPVDKCRLRLRSPRPKS